MEKKSSSISQLSNKVGSDRVWYRFSQKLSILSCAVKVCFSQPSILPQITPASSPRYPSEVARRDRPELYRKVEMFQRRNNEDQPETTTNQEDWTPYDDEMLQQQARDNKIE